MDIFQVPADIVPEKSMLRSKEEAIELAAEVLRMQELFDRQALGFLRKRVLWAYQVLELAMNKPENLTAKQIVDALLKLQDARLETARYKLVHHSIEYQAIFRHLPNEVRDATQKWLIVDGKVDDEERDALKDAFKCIKQRAQIYLPGKYLQGQLFRTLVSGGNAA